MDRTCSFADNLRHRLLGRPCKALPTSIAADAIADGEVLKLLFSFIYEGDDPLRWRAAWALEKVSKDEPSLVVSERSRIKSLVMQPSTPEGLRRLLLGTLYHLLDESYLDVTFLNFLLDTMLDPKSSPGVQSLAMKLAERLSSTASELREEFLCLIRNMEVGYYSAGVQSVVRRCLKSKRPRGSSLD